MIQLIGLTFFCNRCVEVFYRFARDKSSSPELNEIGKQAISAFKSLKWPRESQSDLFNTFGELKCLEKMLKSSEEQNVDDLIDDLRKDIEVVICDEKPLDERVEKAEHLVLFFDTLGDHSVYATKER